MVEALTTIIHEDILGHSLAQILDGLGLARACGSLGTPPLFEVHGGGEREVASVSEVGHDETTVVALVLVAVLVYGVGLENNALAQVSLRFLHELQLLLPFEIARGVAVLL